MTLADLSEFVAPTDEHELLNPIQCADAALRFDGVGERFNFEHLICINRAAPAAVTS